MSGSVELLKAIKSVVENKTQDNKIRFDVLIVTGVNTTTNPGTISARHPILNRQYDNIQMMCVNAGNLRGQIIYPQVDDIVVVVFLDETPNPIMLGSLYDNSSGNPDIKPPIKQNEYFVTNKQLGAIFFMDENNNIFLRATSENGDSNNGAKMILKSNGSFKIYDKSNFGFEFDGNGNLLIRAASSSTSSLPGTFP